MSISPTLSHQVSLFIQKLSVDLSPPDSVLRSGLQGRRVLCCCRLKLETVTVTDKQNPIFRAQNEPKSKLSGLCGKLHPHPEFQSIEDSFGRAAERPLSDHLHGVKQCVAVGPQGTFYLKCWLAHRTGTVIHQLSKSKNLNNMFFIYHKHFIDLKSTSKTCRSSGPTSCSPVRLWWVVKLGGGKMISFGRETLQEA